MCVVTHWKDADSNSAREVANYFGSGKTMLCGGHYTHAYYNHLKKINGKRHLDLVSKVYMVEHSLVFLKRNASA